MFNEKSLKKKDDQIISTSKSRAYAAIRYNKGHFSKFLPKPAAQVGRLWKDQSSF